MKLILPLIAMFIFVGLTQTKLTRQIYLRMMAVIVVALVYFYYTA